MANIWSDYPAHNGHEKDNAQRQRNGRDKSRSGSSVLWLPSAIPSSGDGSKVGVRELSDTQRVSGANPELEWVEQNKPEWEYLGLNANGHNAFAWTDPNGNAHKVTGWLSPNHGSSAGIPPENAIRNLRREMNKCEGGACSHFFSEAGPDEVAAGPADPIKPIQPNQQVLHNDKPSTVLEVEGDLVSIIDNETGAEDIVPRAELVVARVTSAFQGITTPISELYNEIHMRGWQVGNVDIKDGQFIASASNPHGEKVEKQGRDPQTALGALLMYIMRREHIRQGAWSQHWGDQLESIAQAYAKAPHFDAKAAAAWKELADDCVARAHVISNQLAIEVTHDPEPYATPQDMWEDVQKNKHLAVSDFASEHPVWTHDQVIAFRICHDVLGHAAAGGDFGWTGENLATAAHMPYLTPTAQQALFSETVGQAAYRNYFRGLGPQKIALLPDHVEPLQDAENPPGHGGEHPQMSLVPGVMPTRSSAMTRTQLLQQLQAHEAKFGPDQSEMVHSFPDGWTIRQLKTFGDLHREGELMGSCFSATAEKPHPVWDESSFQHEYPTDQEIAGVAHAPLPNSYDFKSLRDPENIPHVSMDGMDTLGRHNTVPKTDYLSRIQQWADQTYPEGWENGQSNGWESPFYTSWGRVGKLAGALRDPNYKYETNIVPPTNNAITAYDDPIDHMAVKDMAHDLDTGWSQWQDPHGKPDVERMKVAVMNAFRAALLSPRKELKWNAVQYQDISHIPYHTSDPKVYYDALENARINHNRAEGFSDPEIRHKAHYEALLDFYRYYQQHNPQLSPSESKSRADREVQIMLAEIEEELLAKDDDIEIMENKVYKDLDKRLKQIVKDDKPLHTAAAEDPYNPDRQAYGAFINRHLVAIAQLSKYADLLTEAALEDVKRHDGAGHTFRSTVLRLDIPYVGPKVVSFAWMLLQPLTSQLAVVDSHMAEALGHKYKDVANNRDYFRLERELQAGRDASGYGHMPLAQFGWGLWDLKRTGMGTHQDHTPLRVWEPKPHYQMDWLPKLPANQHKPDWVVPEWWAITQPHREAEAAAWAHDVAVGYPKNQYPWSDEDAPVPHISARNVYQNIPCPRCGHVGNVTVRPYPEEDGHNAWCYSCGHAFSIGTDLPWEHQMNVEDYRDPYAFEDADSLMGDRPNISGPPRFGSEEGTVDEVHVALDVPEWVRKKISEFVGTLDLVPESAVDPKEYHITLAYAPHGVDQVSVHKVTNNFNLTGLKFNLKSLKKLGDADALVIELENDDFDEYATMLNDFLKDQGIDVTSYDDGYVPHITVAYTSEDAPSAEPMPFSFRAGPLSFSIPRKADEIPSIWARYLAHTLKPKPKPARVLTMEEWGGEVTTLHHGCPRCGSTLTKTAKSGSACDLCHYTW